MTILKEKLIILQEKLREEWVFHLMSVTCLLQEGREPGADSAVILSEVTTHTLRMDKLEHILKVGLYKKY